MGCLVWLIREEGYSVIVVREFGYDFTYFIMGDCAHLIEVTDYKNNLKWIPREEWSEDEEFHINKISLMDRENRFNIVIDLGLQVA